MKNEVWEQWNPSPWLAHSIELKKLTNDLYTFKILLTDCANQENQLLLTFEHSSNFYQKSNRVLWENSIHPLTRQSLPLLDAWAFYKVTNSVYTQQLEQQSLGFYQAKHFVLFVLITKHSVLEILAASTYSPLIEWHKKSS